MSIVDHCKYLIDSNCFIAAKNLYYNPKFCSPFWSVIRELHTKNMLYSVDKVQKELLDGEENDYARVHIAQDDFFERMWLKTSIASSSYKKVVMEASDWYNQNPSKREKALHDFLSENTADAFLLAMAYDHDYTIITHETPSENTANKRIKIPDIANKLNIEYCNLYTVLQKYCNESFSLKI